MMILEIYKESDFKLLSGWITDRELLLQFAGTDFTYPITEKQIRDYQHNHPDRSFYIGYDSDREPFAFGEIIPQETGIPRLGRILIGDPANRGQGKGRSFVNLLINECKAVSRCTSVELFVWDMNKIAVRCYQSIGFSFDVRIFKILNHRGINYNIHKMTYIFHD